MFLYLITANQTLRMTSKMPSVIVDTSCLIVLDNIGLLDILNNIYGEIIITPEVFMEFGKPLPSWIKSSEFNNKESFRVISAIVDEAEASVIQLCIESEDSLLILDDLKARKLASSMNLKVTGTIAVLLKAKKIGLIDDMAKVINDLSNSGFRISKDFEDLLLAE